MNEFMAIDFETGNPQRVSAYASGYAKISHCLKNTKLKTLVNYFGLPAFRHHDAREDTLACAQVFLRLRGLDAGYMVAGSDNVIGEFKGILTDVSADRVVNYKEVSEFLYRLEDHSDIGSLYPHLNRKITDYLSDGHLADITVSAIKMILENILKELS